MKLIKRINNPQFILLAVFFVLMSVSYTTNVFHISDSNLFHGFERQPEGLVIGRLVRSTEKSVFSDGGLTGINYSKNNPSTDEQYAADLAAQHDLYLSNTSIPENYLTYKSQSGGQGIVMSIIQLILPFDNAKKLMFFRGINALLVALIFCLFGGWVFRNFGFVASFVTLLGIFFSPWLNMYSHNLWWVLWNFYLPFITMLLLLEVKHKQPNRISYHRILIALFAAVFLKCFFTGFEFITTTLAAAICPIVYYSYLERKSLRRFVVFSIKASMVMIAAMITQMLVLVAQIASLSGSMGDGINHIVFSFTKRTSIDSVSLGEVFLNYLQDDAFSFGFLSNTISFYFGTLIFILFIATSYLLLKSKNNRKIYAICITFLFSLAAPLSWLIVFKQHAYEHPHMDYLIWYIPFIPFGYVIIGVLIDLLIKQKKRIKTDRYRPKYLADK